MSKKRNYKKDVNMPVEENIEISVAEDELEEIEDNVVDDVIDIDDDDDIDDDMAERLAYYDSEDTEDVDDDVLQDSNHIELSIIGEDDDDEDIQEFLSRDYDIIAESRRRVNQPGKRVERAGKPKKEKKVKLEKEKKERKESEEKDNAIKIFIGKWLDFYHKHTMKILYGTLGVLAAILLVVIIVTLLADNKGGDDEAESTENPSTQEQTTLEQQSETEEQTKEVIQPETEDSDVYALITAYIDAAYIKADMEQVKLYVDDVTNINVETYKSRQKYIESYQNVKCYKLDSAIENSYIIFVTYDAKLYNIETLAPSAETFIIKYNRTESKYYVHNMTVGEELDGYIAEGSKIALISEISADVRKRLEDAIAKDEDLKKVLDIMSNVGKNTEEDTSAAQ